MRSIFDNLIKLPIQDPSSEDAAYFRAWSQISTDLIKINSKIVQIWSSKTKKILGNSELMDIMVGILPNDLALLAKIRPIIDNATQFAGQGEESFVMINLYAAIQTKWTALQENQQLEMTELIRSITEQYIFDEVTEPLKKIINDYLYYLLQLFNNLFKNCDEKTFNYYADLSTQENKKIIHLVLEDIYKGEDKLAKDYTSLYEIIYKYETLQNLLATFSEQNMSLDELTTLFDLKFNALKVVLENNAGKIEKEFIQKLTQLVATHEVKPTQTKKLLPDLKLDLGRITQLKNWLPVPQPSYLRNGITFFARALGVKPKRNVRVITFTDEVPSQSFTH